MVIGNRNNNYDFLRFFAASLVIFSHAFPISYGNDKKEWLQIFSGWQIDFGKIAVMIFFIISGFLITMSFERSKDIKKFIKARVLRIFPGLIVAIIFTAFIIGAIATKLSLIDYFKNLNTYKYLLSALTIYNPNALPGVFIDLPVHSINSSLWTLKFELFCYIIVLALGVFNLLKKHVILAIIALNYVVFIITPWHKLVTLNQYKLFYLLLFFSVGMAFYLYRKEIKLKWQFALISIILLVISMRFGIVLKFVLPFTLAYLVFWFVYNTNIKLNNWAKYGDFSYGLYIYAFPIQQAVQYYTKCNNPYINFIISYPIIFILSFMSWYFIENNFMKFKNVKFDFLFKNKYVNKLNQSELQN